MKIALAILIGFIIGGIVGVAIMCLFQVNRDTEYELEDVAKDNSIKQNERATAELEK